MKNYILPQLLPECNVKKQQFCDTCRDKEKGRPFRTTILKIRGIDNVEVDFECPKNKPWNSEKTTQLTVSAKAKNATAAVAKGVASTLKTQILRKDRTPDEIYKARLNTCANCPGNHAVYKNGALFTCGKFANSITGELPTCGCVLTQKARDIKQQCPMGYWKE